MTKFAGRRCFRHSSFVIPSSFVIRHSSFVIRHSSLVIVIPSFRHWSFLSKLVAARARIRQRSTLRCGDGQTMFAAGL